MLLLLACTNPSPAPTSCDAHPDPDVAAYCWMREGAAAPSPAQALTTCARAADLAPDCRSLWVSAHLQAPDLDADALLAVCRGDDPVAHGVAADRVAGDCALSVLDARPEPDLLAQLARCPMAGPFADDCAVHAFDRWRRAPPDAAEVARVAAAGVYPEHTGRYVAAVVACSGVGDCGEDPAVHPHCEASLREIAQRPEICQ